MDSKKLNLATHQVPYNLDRLFRRPDTLDSKPPLYVITPIINFCRHPKRWKHYEDFAKHVAESGAILITVEVSFGDRDFVVTEEGNPHHIRLRTWHELWLKERAINIGVSRLPDDWSFCAWVDCDCKFTRSDWADETRHLLQHYPMIQMWSQLHDLNSDNEVTIQLRSFMDVHKHGGGRRKDLTPDVYPCIQPPLGPVFGSPGLAWACRREAWQQIGGLPDFCILGAGDWYFANAMMGTLTKMLAKRNDVTGPFVRKMEEYAERVKYGRWEERPLVGSVGLMPGLVLHYFHGSRTNRRYGTRGNILMKHQFDPDRDLKPDWQGLMQLSGRTPALRRDIQKYFAQLEEE